MIEGITINPSIRHDKPLVRGTRVSVHRVIGSTCSGGHPFVVTAYRPNTQDWDEGYMRRRT